MAENSNFGIQDDPGTQAQVASALLHNPSGIDGRLAKEIGVWLRKSPSPSKHSHSRPPEPGSHDQQLMEAFLPCYPRREKKGTQ
jgi:hypothetical protein